MTAFSELNRLSVEQESRLLIEWLPLVKRVSRQLAPQASQMLGRDDIEQIALMGLLEALRRYGEPDAQFAAYALQRIRGAVLDQLRVHDWRPRSLRQKTHRMNDEIRALQRTLGHEPSEAEICRHLALSSEEYHGYLQDEAASVLESFDHLLDSGAEETRPTENPVEEQVDRQRTLALALASLDEREQLILSLYYQQDLSLKEIALTLDLTEARICQINKKISEKIKQYF